MRIPLLTLAAALTGLSASAHAQALHETIARDMPGLMTIYRDLHANP